MARAKGKKGTPPSQQEGKQESPQDIQDPYAAREAENYENPIPSREFILDYFEKSGEPITYDALCQQLSLESYDQTEALRRRLIAMARDGQLISNRRGVYGLADKMELIKGRVQGTKDGIGFFIPTDGSGDLFLSPGEMKKVFDGDIVLARVSGVDRRGRREGMIVEVLERRSSQIVGRYYWEHGFGVVVPDNRRNSQEIMIPESENRGAQDGQFVVAEITTYPTSRRKPVGRIVEILGDSMTPGMEIEVAVRSHEIPHEWPKEVTRMVKDLKPEVQEEDKTDRVDLRHLPFVTIDGEDAKDFDDAVYCQPNRSGWTLRAGCKLFVAIADVSHYVEAGNPLDIEAQNRGNSVYFPGHVIPMLPEVLSNGLCSLKPKVDRLVMVCEMQINRYGQLDDYSFYEAVIHSHARLTYNEVSDMVEEPSSSAKERQQKRLRKRYENVVPHLESLHALYHKLAKAREANGSLDFSSRETRIVFGETRKIREIVPVTRNDAHRMIEECMLIANVATARFLAETGLPVLYRIHEGPNSEKLENLREFLKEMGLMLSRSGKPTPKDYQRVLKKAADRPDAHLIQTVMVRSLMQAVYSPENIGHFGLNFEAYTHFTSPIRRYPDLLVHRALRFMIRNKAQKKHVVKVKGVGPLARKKIYPYQFNDIQSFGETCSMTERRADAAGYDVTDWLKCEYIKDRVGDEFSATVISVTGFGLFAELNDIYVEGLVHITALENDYYRFDPVHHVLTGEHNGISYHIGDTIRVKVARVDLDERKIDLVMAEEGKRGRTGGSAKPAGRGRGGKRGGDTKGSSARGSQPGRREDQAAAGKAGAAKKSSTGKSRRRPNSKPRGRSDK